MESMQLKKLIFWRLYKLNIGCIAGNSKINEIVECGLHILFGSSGFSCLPFVGTRFGSLFRLNGAADLGTSVQKHHSEMISPKFRSTIAPIKMARVFIIHRGLDRLERRIWSLCRRFSG